MAVGDFTTFSYTGAAQTMQLLAGKKYKIECWGAQGGNSAGQGGKGGYASGVFTPQVDTDINIYVGGQPSNATGGFNGGGNGGSVGGGGASDVRIGGNALTDRKLIAAGGGGGGATLTDAFGGFGGGENGQTGYQYSTYLPGTGATQAAGGDNGGSLGVGGAATEYRGGGGGGGYYGGGGAQGRYCGGGGGSSYVGGLDASYTDKDINTGNGSVKITEIDTSLNIITEESTYEYTGQPQRLFLKKGKYSIKAYGGKGGSSPLESGGLGGYCGADIELMSNKDVLLMVGGAGATETGGFNGGGNGYQGGGGGGGGSDVRIGGGWTSRILVAGGGGGGGGAGMGGNGGGLTGDDGESDAYVPGKGGTQSVGGDSWGALGQGGNAYGANRGGGGGGLYGGGSGGIGMGGGGGSSYYGTLENAETLSGVNDGDGYIVITPLDKPYSGFPQII